MPTYAPTTVEKPAMTPLRELTSATDEFFQSPEWMGATSEERKAHVNRIVDLYDEVLPQVQPDMNPDEFESVSNSATELLQQKLGESNDPPLHETPLSQDAYKSADELLRTRQTAAHKPELPYDESGIFTPSQTEAYQKELDASKAAKADYPQKRRAFALATGLRPEQADRLLDDQEALKTLKDKPIVSKFSGDVFVPPQLSLDKEAWDSAVDSTSADPKKKAKAKALRVKVRDQVAQSAAVTLAFDPEWARWNADIVKHEPSMAGADNGERVERFLKWRKLNGGKTAAISQAITQNLAGLSKQLYGVLGIVSSNAQDTAEDAATVEQAAAQNRATYGGAGAVGLALDITASLAPSLAFSPLARLAMTNAGAIRVMSGIGALQSYGGVRTDASRAYQQQGIVQQEARMKAQVPALVSALTTYALARMMPRGVESAGINQAKEAAKLSWRKWAGELGKDVADEAVEEALQTTVDEAMAKITYDPNKDMATAVRNILTAGFMGGIGGGFVGAASRYSAKVKPIMDAAEKMRRDGFPLSADAMEKNAELQAAKLFWEETEAMKQRVEAETSARLDKEMREQQAATDAKLAAEDAAAKKPAAAPSETTTLAETNAELSALQDKIKQKPAPKESEPKNETQDQGVQTLPQAAEPVSVQQAEVTEPPSPQPPAPVEAPLPERTPEPIAAPRTESETSKWVRAGREEQDRQAVEQKRKEAERVKAEGPYELQEPKARRYIFMRDAQASGELTRKDAEEIWEQVGIDEHRDAIEAALKASRPVSAAAVETYATKLPEGYVKTGETYTPAPTPAQAAVREAQGYQMPKDPNEGTDYLVSFAKGRGEEYDANEAAHEKALSEWEASIPQNKALIFKFSHTGYGSQFKAVTRDTGGAWRTTSFDETLEMPMGHEVFKTRLDAIKSVQGWERIEKLPFTVKAGEFHGQRTPHLWLKERGKKPRMVKFGGYMKGGERAEVIDINKVFTGGEWEQVDAGNLSLPTKEENAKAHALLDEQWRQKQEAEKQPKPTPVQDAVKAEKHKRKRTGLPPAPGGGWDIIDALQDIGKLRTRQTAHSNITQRDKISAALAWKKVGGEYDMERYMLPNLRPHLLAPKGSGMTPDEAAQTLYEAGILKDASPDTLYAELNAAYKTRVKALAEERSMQSQQKVADREMAAMRPEDMPDEWLQDPVDVEWGLDTVEQVDAYAVANEFVPEAATKEPFEAAHGAVGQEEAADAEGQDRAGEAAAGGEVGDAEYFGNVLRMAADKPNELRVPDVDRVMSAVKPEEVEAFRAWLLDQGPFKQPGVATEIVTWTPEMEVGDAKKTPEQLEAERVADEASKAELQKAQDFRLAQSRRLMAKDDIRSELDMFESPDAQADIFDKPGAIDAAIARLGAAKKKPSDTLQVAIFPGLDPASFRAIWNTGIDIAIGTLKLTRSVAKAIQSALDHFRASGHEFNEVAAKDALSELLLPNYGGRKGVPAPENEGLPQPESSPKLRKLDRSEEGAVQLPSGDEPQGGIAGTGTLLPNPASNAPVVPIKPMSEIIRDIAKGIGIPIRFGRLTTKKFAGYFKKLQNLIGAKSVNDMAIVSHEVGHKLDDTFGFSKYPRIRAELNALGDPATPGSRSSWTKSKPLSYKYGEGVAEFVRHWITDPAKAAADAPLTNNYFEQVMDSNPDFGDVMKQAREDVQNWRNAPAEARLDSHISVGDNPNQTKYRLPQLTRDLVDDLHILRLAFDDLKKLTGKDVAPSDNGYLLARLLRGSYGMADTFIRQGTVDFKTRAVTLGNSFEDALKPVAGRINEFRRWIVAKRAAELHNQGRETGLVPSDVDEVLKKYVAEPDFQDTFDKLKAWNDSLLQYAVDSGYVSQESADAMRAMNQDYVPFHRIFEIGAGESPSQQSSGAGRGLNVGKAGSLKRLQGSQRDIVDPLETMIKNAYVFITASEKAAINKAIANLSNAEGMGKWVEKIATPKEAVKVELEKVREQLEASGADLENVPDDLVMQFFQNSGRVPFGENIIKVTSEGQTTFYRLKSDLFDAFHALDLDDSSKLIQILSAPAQVLRAGVTLDPAFGLANVMRDAVGSAVINRYGMLPFEASARGVAALLKNPKLVSEWAASGGEQSFEASFFDRKKMAAFMRERITKDMTKAEQAMVILKSPLTALRYIGGLAEAATRIGEYDRAYKEAIKGGMSEGDARRQAAFESRDRQDFAKGGAKTKILRHAAAFWNAGLQGNVAVAQAFKNRPVRTTLQGLAFITLPTVLLMALNHDDKDYWDRPQWERDAFWLIPIGKDANKATSFLRIPKPFILGLMFGALPERMMAHAMNKDPKPFKNIMQTMVKDVVPNPMPQFAQTIIADVFTGKQGWDMWRNRPVVPDSLAELPPEMQWTEQTSLTARKVGAMIPKFLGGPISPMKVDHMIAGTTGGLGRQLVHNVIDRAIGAATGEQPTATRVVPGMRFLTVPAGISSQSVTDFYDNLTALREQKAGAKAGKKMTSKDRNKLAAMETAADAMSKLRKVAQKAKTQDDKQKVYLRIRDIAARHK